MGRTKTTSGDSTADSDGLPQKAATSRRKRTGKKTTFQKVEKIAVIMGILSAVLGVVFWSVDKYLTRKALPHLELVVVNSAVKQSFGDTGLIAGAEIKNVNIDLQPRGIRYANDSTLFSSDFTFIAGIRNKGGSAASSIVAKISVKEPFQLNVIGPDLSDGPEGNLGTWDYGFNEETGENYVVYINKAQRLLPGTAEATYGVVSIQAPRRAGKAEIKVSITCAEVAEFTQTIPFSFRAHQLSKAEIDNEAGMRLLQDDRWEDALACFRKVASSQPESAQAHFNCATCLLLLDRVDEAQKCLEKAKALDGSYGPTYGNLAAVALSKEQWSLGEALAKQSLKLVGDNYVDLSNLVKALEAQQKTKEAKEARKRLESLD